MKTLIGTVSLILLAILMAWPGEVSAQVTTVDTLDITALPVGNINTVIVGDTLAGGVRAHPNRVYRLKRGNVYQVTSPIKVKGNLIICATAGTERPPVLAPAILADNSSIDNFFDLQAAGKVELYNLYLLSVRSDQNQLGWSEAIRVNAPNIKLKLKGVVFDAFTSAGIRQYAKWVSLHVEDCVFRNMQHASSYFGGQPFLSDGLCSADTIRFVNNTFFANNSYSFSVRGYDRFAQFEHNTMVYGIVNPFLFRQVQNMKLNNNLFYTMHAYGGIPEHLRDAWFLNYPDTTASSIIFLRAKTETVDGNLLKGQEGLIDSAGQVYASMLQEKDRDVKILNNSYFFPQKLKDFYKAYNDTVKTTNERYGVQVKRTLTMPMWINNYTQKNIDSVLPKISPLVKVSGNIEADPGFSADIVNHIDKVIQYIVNITQDKFDKPWFFTGTTTTNLYPPVWPLPEKLNYTNTTLQKAGTDGLALGDLNWFPDQKAKWNPTGVELVKSTKPEDYSLSQNYPNPFNPETKITFAMKNAGSVKIVVYNLLGQAVRTLANSEMNAGTYSVSFNGRDDMGRQLASGIYMYSLESSNVKITKKMMLLK